MIGINQSVRLCEDNKLFLSTDTVVAFAHREFANVRRRQQQKIPLLDDIAKSVVGVRVKDLHSTIEDPLVRSEIEAALKKITFNVHYVIPYNAERSERELTYYTHLFVHFEETFYMFSSQPSIPLFSHIFIHFPHTQG